MVEKITKNNIFNLYMHTHEWFVCMVYTCVCMFVCMSWGMQVSLHMCESQRTTFGVVWDRVSLVCYCVCLGSHLISFKGSLASSPHLSTWVLWLQMCTTEPDFTWDLKSEPSPHNRMQVPYPLSNLPSCKSRILLETEITIYYSGFYLVQPVVRS